ncbi:YoaK family protein [uncultured Brevundimonas sp.]|uniref:YoaK family protein n=1 Tax=uncultured Brevundimonas sp. TaxID=213418 RepID=UPI0025FC1DED|nr:YoaK family protein [uncultured Brevundimonas sp.]
MRALPPPHRALALSLAVLAGYVDSLGFLQLGGVFVSFMSGNSTRLAASLAEGRWAAAGGLAGILILFVMGSFFGALIARGQQGRSRSRVLAFEGGLLTLAALASWTGHKPVAIGLMVMAMAAENSVFLRNGEVAVSLTYMTGTLVKLGQSLAAAVMGGDRWGFGPYLVLWAGLTGGAVVEALTFGRLGLAALWPAAAFAFLLAVVTRFSRAA